MQESTNYYTMLGVPTDAPEEKIRRAFRIKAKALHPDRQKGGGHAGTGHDFSQLTEAYETLKDATRRNKYDESLAGARRLGSPGKVRGRLYRAFAAGLGAGFLLMSVIIGINVCLQRAAFGCVQFDPRISLLSFTWQPW